MTSMKYVCLHAKKFPFFQNLTMAILDILYIFPYHIYSLRRFTAQLS